MSLNFISTITPSDTTKLSITAQSAAVHCNAWLGIHYLICQGTARY
ncbi:MAG: hypothetical protein AB1414_11515 [bacterium]